MYVLEFNFWKGPLLFFRKNFAGENCNWKIWFLPVQKCFKFKTMGYFDDNFVCMLFLMTMIVLLHVYPFIARIDVNQNEAPYFGAFFFTSTKDASNFVFRHVEWFTRLFCSLLFLVRFFWRADKCFMAFDKRTFVSGFLRKSTEQSKVHDKFSNLPSEQA